MPDLPAAVKIGYRDWSVVAMPPLEASTADIYGDCNKLLGVIRVRADCSPAMQAEILLHEILHALHFTGQLSDEDKEERLVAVLAIQLASLWRDNPDLVSFLSESLS